MKYYLWILGCAMNYSDAERLVSVLESLGYSRTVKEDEADIVFVIACSVRQSAIDRIYGKTKTWRKIKKKRVLKLFLSGCVLEKDQPKMKEIFNEIFDIKDLSNLPGLLGEKNRVAKDYLKIKPEYGSDFQAYMPISTGCDNFCSYCAVPYTRGREKSRSKNEIIGEVRDLVGRGYKEITLLGQNVNSYGQDLKGKNDNSEFISLLEEIDKISGDYRIYFYSNHPKDMTDDLIDCISELKHFPRYIHLPLQSGNDEIIKKMNRHYTKEKYLKLAKKIKEKIPDVVLTTDVIVGFPGEGEKEFNDTKEVMEKVGFEMAFIAQYSKRPGTKAAKLTDDISKSEKVRREKILTKVLAESSLKKNKKLIGKKVRVLFDKEKNGKAYGRTDGYKVVEVKTDRNNLTGRFLQVEIVEVTPWKLIGFLTSDRDY